MRAGSSGLCRPCWWNSSTGTRRPSQVIRHDGVLFLGAAVMAVAGWRSRRVGQRSPRRHVAGLSWLSAGGHRSVRAGLRCGTEPITLPGVRRSSPTTCGGRGAPCAERFWPGQRAHAWVAWPPSSRSTMAWLPGRPGQVGFRPQTQVRGCCQDHCHRFFHGTRAGGGPPGCAGPGAVCSRSAGRTAGRPGSAC